MSDVVMGRDVALEVNIDGSYKAIGCAVSCTFEFLNEIILKTSVNSGLFKERKVRFSDCRASFSGLTTLTNNSTQSVMYFLMEGVRRLPQDLRFTFTDEAGTGKQIQGMFLIESIPLTADVSTWSNADINFIGTGGFTLSAITGDPGADLPGEVNWDVWEPAEGATSVTGNGVNGRSFEDGNVVLVFREGTEYDLIDSGDPVGRQAKRSGNDIVFDPTLPFPADMRVYIVWQEPF